MLEEDRELALSEEKARLVKQEPFTRILALKRKIINGAEYCYSSSLSRYVTTVADDAPMHLNRYLSLSTISFNSANVIDIDLCMIFVCMYV